MSELTAPTFWEHSWSYPLHLLAAHGVAHGGEVDLSPWERGLGRVLGGLCRVRASLTQDPLLHPTEQDGWIIPIGLPAVRKNS